MGSSPYPPGTHKRVVILPVYPKDRPTPTWSAPYSVSKDIAGVRSPCEFLRTAQPAMWFIVSDFMSNAAYEIQTMGQGWRKCFLAGLAAQAGRCGASGAEAVDFTLKTV